MPPSEDLSIVDEIIFYRVGTFRTGTTKRLWVPYRWRQHLSNGREDFCQAKTFFLLHIPKTTSIGWFAQRRESLRGELSFLGLSP